MHDSNYDSSPEEEGDGDEGGDPIRGGGGRKRGNQSSSSSSKFRNLHFKFGTDMPSTIDLKSAIESCDILCRFALHYGKQVSNGNIACHETVQGTALGLDPNERANLQRIRSMNTTMLIGIQKAEKANDPSSSAATAAGSGGESGEAPRMKMEEEEEEEEEEEIDWHERDEGSQRFGPGQPWNVMVLELARAATSIFQLAIRIKAWVNMTPEERELDEEINMIRGKRCLLMDSTLAVPTVDQHGNLQKDWAVVPAATSTSKSFYQRQRDLEQQRQTHVAVVVPKPKLQTQSMALKRDLSTSVESNGFMDHDDINGENVYKIPRRNSNHGGVRSGRHDSSKIGEGSGSGTGAGAGGVLVLGGGSSGGAGAAVDAQMASSHTSTSSSIQSGYSQSTEGTRNSKNSDAPHQKYRKRAKRSQAPGRCQSCHSSDTPEWRRGPDGARTLCNACGLHYAKLLRRQNEQAQQQSPSRISIALPSSSAGTFTASGGTSTVASTSTALTPSTPSAPVSAIVGGGGAAEAIGGKVTSRPSPRTDSSFPVISFPFKRLHGLGRPAASATSTATATATTATSTATVMTTTSSGANKSGKNAQRSSSSSSPLTLSSSSSSTRRTLTDHQVVPGMTSGSIVSSVPVVSRGTRVGPMSSSTPSQYQQLQRQQQQYMQMQEKPPQQPRPQHLQEEDVTMDESPRIKRNSP
ncbi:hypothetical protein BGX23_001629 [Mortierella sp. AD031]|nr:hypothetical protein BGX23_001629 [Mortierella sp. AD031]